MDHEEVISVVCRCNFISLGVCCTILVFITSVTFLTNLSTHKIVRHIEDVPVKLVIIVIFIVIVARSSYQ